MMSTNKNFIKELNASMQDCNLPQIDVTDKVMQAISGTTVRRYKSWLAISMAATVILASGFGYAASSWKLFGGDGSVVLEYQSFLPNDQPVDVTIDLLQYIPEGEAALFYFKDSGSFISQVNEKVVTRADELVTAGVVPEPRADLSQGYTFLNGKLIHNIEPSPQMMEELVQKASQSNEEFVFDLLAHSGTIGYFATYQNAEGLTVTLDSLEGERWKKIFTDNMDHIKEKLQFADGTEALYIEDAAGKQRIVWMSEANGQLVYYSLQSDVATKEQLIQLAEGI